MCPAFGLPALEALKDRVKGLPVLWHFRTVEEFGRGGSGVRCYEVRSTGTITRFTL